MATSAGSSNFDSPVPLAALDSEGRFWGIVGCTEDEGIWEFVQVTEEQIGNQEKKSERQPEIEVKSSKGAAEAEGYGGQRRTRLEQVQPPQQGARPPRKGRLLPQRKCQPPWQNRDWAAVRRRRTMESLPQLRLRPPAAAASAATSAAAASAAAATSVAADISAVAA